MARKAATTRKKTTRGKKATKGIRITRKQKEEAKEAMAAANIRPDYDIETADSDLPRIFSWYRERAIEEIKDKETSKKKYKERMFNTLLNYLEATGATQTYDKMVAKKEVVLEHMIDTDYFIADLLLDEVNLPVPMINRFHGRIMVYLNKTVKVVKPVEWGDIIPQRTEVTFDEVIEGMIDDCVEVIKANKLPQFDYMDYVEEYGITWEAHERMAAKYLEIYRDEISVAYANYSKKKLDDDTQQIVDAYKCWSKPQLKALGNVYWAVISAEF